MSFIQSVMLYLKTAGIIKCAVVTILEDDTLAVTLKLTRDLTADEWQQVHERAPGVPVAVDVINATPIN